MSYFYQLQIHREDHDNKKDIILTFEDSLQGEDFSIIITQDGDIYELSYENDKEKNEIVCGTLYEFLSKKITYYDMEYNNFFKDGEK